MAKLITEELIKGDGGTGTTVTGRYEEQAYFWRMLKLVGHKDVTLYEMQGYDHGAMPFPAYKILKDHIRRITAKMSMVGAPYRQGVSVSTLASPSADCTKVVR